MYKVGDLREVQERSTAGTGWSEATSILSKRVCTCVCSLWFFMVHTWMLSSSRLLRTPSRLSTKSKRWRQPSQIFKKRKLWIIPHLPISARWFLLTPNDLMVQQLQKVFFLKIFFWHRHLYQAADIWEIQEREGCDMQQRTPSQDSNRGQLRKWHAR